VPRRHAKCLRPAAGPVTDSAGQPNSTVSALAEGDGDE